MQCHGLAEHIETIRATHEAVAATAMQIATSPNRPEAVFCWGDAWALRLISAANSRGLRIPQDLRIVGYDNNQYCDLAQNSLTSVDQSGRKLGMEAARLLIERIEGRRNPCHFVATPRLVIRNSTGSE
jgi:LacI family transcriptional regulator